MILALYDIHFFNTWFHTSSNRNSILNFSLKEQHVPYTCQSNQSCLQEGEFFLLPFKLHSLFFILLLLLLIIIIYCFSSKLYNFLLIKFCYKLGYNQWLHSTRYFFIRCKFLTNLPFDYIFFLCPSCVQNFQKIKNQ